MINRKTGLENTINQKAKPFWVFLSFLKVTGFTSGLTLCRLTILSTCFPFTAGDILFPTVKSPQTHPNIFLKGKRNTPLAGSNNF